MHFIEVTKYLSLIKLSPLHRLCEQGGKALCTSFAINFLTINKILRVLSGPGEVQSKKDSRTKITEIDR